MDHIPTIPECLALLALVFALVLALTFTGLRIAAADAQIGRLEQEIQEKEAYHQWLESRLEDRATAT